MRGTRLGLLLLGPPSGRRELVILVFGGGPKLVSQIGSKADFKQHPHGMVRFPGASEMVSWRLLGPPSGRRELVTLVF